jgi:amino acid adenylation domain-containing protein
MGITDGAVPIEHGLVEPFADESVCIMFERQVRRTPEAVAVVWDGRSLTYRELQARVSQLARRLNSRFNIGRESIVALLLGRSERMLISILAVLKAGGAYVPISPDYPASRIASILEDASPALLLLDGRHEALVCGYSGTMLSWDDPATGWDDENTELPSGEPDTCQLAYIMYTSGSTGRPKGVMVEHRNLSNFIQWCRQEYRDSKFDVVYAATPYGFDLSNIELFFPLTIGRKIRLLPSNQVMGLYLKRERSVMVNTVPSLVQEMLKTPGILDNVSVLNLGGESLPPSLWRALRPYANIEIRNMYGPTETTSTAINYRMDRRSDDVLIGTPIANNVAYILDRDLRRVPAGVKGEIFIGGRGLARGYWNRPSLTRERFIDDPYRVGQRMYRTGDIGLYLADGRLRFIGRNDNQIKRRGFRIELDEIGYHLACHPDVKDAIVGLANADGRDRLVAFVCCNSAVDRATLEKYLRKALPHYMIPDEFVALQRFPLTPTGKIDRLALFPAATGASAAAASEGRS